MKILTLMWKNCQWQLVFRWICLCVLRISSSAIMAQCAIWITLTNFSSFGPSCTWALRCYLSSCFIFYVFYIYIYYIYLTLYWILVLHIITSTCLLTTAVCFHSFSWCCACIDLYPWIITADSTGRFPESVGTWSNRFSSLFFFPSSSALTTSEWLWARFAHVGCFIWRYLTTPW